ncbi:hypothetical protein ACOSQ3_016642 [Xanthoceras sorbifolium]
MVGYFSLEQRLCVKSIPKSASKLLNTLHEGQISPSPLSKPPTNSAQTKRSKSKKKCCLQMRSYILSLLLLMLVLCHGVAMMRETVHMEEGEEGDWGGEREMEERGWEEEEEGEQGRQDEGSFLLQRSMQVVKTAAGEMRVVMTSGGGRVADRPMHIGFITMEPETLFVPQYIDSSLILFVNRGEATVGSIYKNELEERQLKTGDVIDPSESLGLGAFRSFFIGGGSHSTSLLAGFHRETLANAFNVSESEVEEILNKPSEGPIVYMSDSHSPSLWAKFLQLKKQDRLQQLKGMVGIQQEPEEEEEEEDEEEQITTWSWRKLNSVFGIKNNKGQRGSTEYPDSYNIYDRSPDFKNNYGWSIALDESDCSPPKHSGIGVYLVNLTAQQNTGLC